MPFGISSIITTCHYWCSTTQLYHFFKDVIEIKNVGVAELRYGSGGDNKAKAVSL